MTRGLQGGMRTISYYCSSNKTARGPPGKNSALHYAEGRALITLLPYTCLLLLLLCPALLSPEPHAHNPTSLM